MQEKLCSRSSNGATKYITVFPYSLVNYFMAGNHKSQVTNHPQHKTCFSPLPFRESKRNRLCFYVCINRRLFSSKNGRNTTMRSDGSHLRAIQHLSVSSNLSNDWPRSVTVHVCPCPPHRPPATALCSGLRPLQHHRGSDGSFSVKGAAEKLRSLWNIQP